MGNPGGGGPRRVKENVREGDGVKRQSLWFDGGSRVTIREEELPPPAAGEVLLENVVSAISPGTEMLFYRGQLEQGAVVDTVLEGYSGGLSYPLRYGYASVGRIAGVGPGVDPAAVGRLAFAFVPHASHACLPADRVLPVPGGLGAEEAAFLASAETATNLVLDARPLYGERVSVFGLGVIGLLTAGLLAGFPVERLTGWDLHPLRRSTAATLGVEAKDPSAAPPAPGTEDLAVEVSGSADGFRLALSSCGFAGRVVVGSWYGTGSRHHSFDTLFHRNRVRIIPSQVSTIAPELSGRWTRERRLEAAWQAIRSLRPGRLVTHRVPFEKAADAYRLIEQNPAETIQVMLTHGNGSEGSRRTAP
jgi:2-desacetyl-2-hydroxyethyl bacteriochlorophyllide A dehydrogenase